MPDAVRRCEGARVVASATCSAWAERLWERRVAAGRRLREVAQTMDVSPARLSDLEHGRTEPTELERAASAILFGEF